MRLFRILMLATVLSGICLTFTACSDDDEEKSGSEQKKSDVDPLDTDDARVAFRWLCALTDVQTIDVNWRSKTYEPTVGQPSEMDQFTRLIVVNDLDEAKISFSCLADVSPDALGAKYTVNGGAAGTMTWTVSAARAENLAVVEVSSRLFPHLHKLVYCTSEQTGQNGVLWDSMKGVAFYRFGDVVEDDDGYFWVCVRPSFAPDKADSHWINIFNASKTGSSDSNFKRAIPQENVYTAYNGLDKYNKVPIFLPTKLPYHRTHIYNLSNLIWALLHPDAYKTACLANKSKGLGGFDYQYHGEKFVKSVAAFWNRPKRDVEESHTVWERLFNRTYEEMQQLKEIRFYYQGYKWWWGNTADMWRYSSTGYQAKNKGSESDDKVSIDVVSGGFDIRRYAGDPAASQVGEAPFFKDLDDKYIGTWVVRYKTGAQLSSTGHYSPYEGLFPYYQDIYRYNECKMVTAGEKEKQETETDFKTADAQNYPDKGSVLANNGQFYFDAADAIASDVTPVAIVVYIGKQGRSDQVERGKQWTGLAMALEDVGEYEWAAATNRDYETCTQPISDATMFSEYLDGYQRTDRLRTGCNLGHSHPAASVCRSYEPAGLTEEILNENGLSRWFLPSVGQWIKALGGMDVYWDNELDKFTESKRGNSFKSIVDFFNNHKLSNSTLSGRYWTSSEGNVKEAYNIVFEENQPVEFSTCDEDDDEDDDGNVINEGFSRKTTPRRVRPFIAF